MQSSPANAPGHSAPQEVPDKLYFRIGDVSKITGIKPYVLRYWETEFPSISPKKSGTGHRLYRRKDVLLILEIKELLYEKRYTIEGARKAIEARSKSQPPRHVTPPVQGDLFPSQATDLAEIRSELEAILKLLV